MVRRLRLRHPAEPELVDKMVNSHSIPPCACIGRPVRTATRIARRNPAQPGSAWTSGYFNRRRAPGDGARRSKAFAATRSSRPAAAGRDHFFLSFFPRRCPACAGLRLAIFVVTTWTLPVDGGMADPTDGADTIPPKSVRKRGWLSSRIYGLNI